MLCTPQSEPKLLSQQNKGFFEYYDRRKHPRQFCVCVCVIGRKIFPAQSRRACRGESLNTRVVCSAWRSLPGQHTDTAFVSPVCVHALHFVFEYVLYNRLSCRRVDVFLSFKSLRPFYTDFSSEAGQVNCSTPGSSADGRWSLRLSVSACICSLMLFRWFDRHMFSTQMRKHSFTWMHSPTSDT